MPKMTVPSLKTAQAELRRRLERIDDIHTRAIANLPDGHSWSDIDRLEIERCDMALEAHANFKAAQAAWDAYVLAHSDQEPLG
jgi:hypothetical protein